MTQAPDNWQPSFDKVLEHAWKRYEFRAVRGLQILNYYIITVALLSAAFASALAGKIYEVAGSIAIAGSLVSIAAFLAGSTQTNARKKPGSLFINLRKHLLI